jgi:hypothetical protein
MLSISALFSKHLRINKLYTKFSECELGLDSGHLTRAPFLAQPTTTSSHSMSIVMRQVLVLDVCSCKKIGSLLTLHELFGPMSKITLPMTLS